MTTESTTPSNKPTHHAFQVRDRENAKAIWTRIGTAWSHKDGQGFSIQLDAVPLDGRISLRVIAD
jgi:hypothetical protein